MSKWLFSIIFFLEKLRTKNVEKLSDDEALKYSFRGDTTWEDCKMCMHTNQFYCAMVIVNDFGTFLKISWMLKLFGALFASDSFEIWSPFDRP